MCQKSNAIVEYSYPNEWCEPLGHNHHSRNHSTINGDPKTSDYIPPRSVQRAQESIHQSNVTYKKRFPNDINIANNTPGWGPGNVKKQVTDEENKNTFGGFDIKKRQETTYAKKNKGLVAAMHCEQRA